MNFSVISKNNTEIAASISITEPAKSVIIFFPIVHNLVTFYGVIIYGGLPGKLYI